MQITLYFSFVKGLIFVCKISCSVASNGKTLALCHWKLMLLIQKAESEIEAIFWF